MVPKFYYASKTGMPPARLTGKTQTMTAKTYSPAPFFLLCAIFGGTGFLNGRYPGFFFPAVPLGWVWGISVLGGLLCGGEALRRWAVRLKRLANARALVRKVGEERRPPEGGLESEAANAGRLISRLTRNAEEDLREIGPDFSVASLRRLYRYLPDLLFEIGNEEEARIRLGIVGTYVGETACRNFKWRWFFKADPALRQFNYMVSVIQRQGRETDPYALAQGLMAAGRNIGGVLKEIQ